MDRRHSLRRPPRTTHPARPFIVVLLLLSLFALVAYFRIPQPDIYHERRSLSASNNQSTPWGDDADCHHVHKYKLQDQCAFIQDNCEDEEVGLFSYLDLYYCRMPTAKPLAFTIIALWTALLFTTIGVAASDFFCINLSTISALLGLSESMAGVTFLAFGNGSPDVFSTFAAVKSHSGSLAIGELIGAAGFITAVVSGSMAIIRPFHVYKRSFVRDVGFFILAVAFSMVFLANGALTLWECAVMVAFYVFYVLVVVIWHWWLTRTRKRRERESAARGHYIVAETDEVEGEEEYHDEETSSRKTGSRTVSNEDFSALERASYLDGEDYEDLDDEETRDKWMGELTSNMRITKPLDRPRQTVFTPIRPSLVGALEFRSVLSSLQKSRNISSPPISMRRYSDAPYYTTAQQQDNEDGLEDPAGARHAFQTSLDDQALNGRLSISKTRGRAVSVNDAANLRRSRDQLRELESGDLLGDPALPPEQSRDVYGTFADKRLDKKSLSPVLSVSPAPDGDYFPPQTRSRVSTSDLLSVPDIQGHRKSKSTGSLLDGSTIDKPERPMLAIPGSSSRSSPKVSPLHSPLLLAMNRRDSAGRVLSFPITEPEESSPPKSYYARWWPHETLPAPTLMLRALFPTLSGWRKKSIWEKMLGLCTAPSFFLLTITLPIVEPQSDDAQEKSDVDPTTPAASTPGAPQPAKAPERSRSSMHPHSSTASTAIGVEQSHNHTHAQGPEGQTAEPNQPPPPTTEHTSVTTSNPKEWNRWLVLIQSLTSPFFIVLVFWANFSESASDLLKPALYSLLVSLLLLVLLLTTTTPARPPRWHFLLCFAGFAVSIAWISTIANEVVGVLKTIGVIFNMSDAILGLTIFAVGNSLGDLVADITVARLGYPVMALSACFGGPMLNILLGIGLSGLYMSIHKAEKRQHRHPNDPMRFKPYHVQVSTTLLVSAVALLVTLVGLLIAVPMNGWKMDRKIGWGLIALWCVSTVGNVVVEVTGVGEGVVDDLAMRWRMGR